MRAPVQSRVDLPVFKAQVHMRNHVGSLPTGGPSAVSSSGSIPVIRSVLFLIPNQSDSRLQQSDAPDTHRVSSLGIS